MIYLAEKKKIVDFFKNQNIKEVYKGSQLVWNKKTFYYK